MKSFCIIDIVDSTPISAYHMILFRTDKPQIVDKIIGYSDDKMGTNLLTEIGNLCDFPTGVLAG